MRKKIYFLLMLLMTGLTLVSCGDDEPVDPHLNSRRGWFGDGGKICGIDFYAFGRKESDCFVDYSGLYFRVEFKIDESSYHRPYVNDEEEDSVSSILRRYYMEKADFVLRDCGNNWVEFYTAYTYDKVAITCDKTLFGQEPGTDLSPFFKMQHTLPYLLTGTEHLTYVYKFGEERPSNMHDYFPVGVWLWYYYAFVFNTIPEEKYDKLTFHLSMPVRKEYMRDYFIAKYRGLGEPMRTEDMLMEADAEVNFNWNASGK